MIMAIQLRTIDAPNYIQPAGLPGSFSIRYVSSLRCSTCAGLICSLSRTYPGQDRKKADSRLFLLGRKTIAVAACASPSYTHASDAANQSDEDMPSPSQQNHVDNGHSKKALTTRSAAATAELVFDVMIDMAKDPALLELFYPYLPKTWRTHAGLVKATKVASWRRQLLVGESQVRESEIMAHVWTRAAERDKLNEELRKLGFFGLMK